MKNKFIFISFILLTVILSKCKKKEVIQQEESISNVKVLKKSLSYFCDGNSNTKFGVKVDNGQIFCAKYPEIFPKIDTDKQLKMYYGFNDCCAAIYFRTINFNEKATSDIVIMRFGTLDGTINFQNYSSDVPNGKLTIVNIIDKKLSGEFEAKINFNNKDFSIVGNFKDVQFEGL
jgi:hypothetical protein